LGVSPSQAAKSRPDLNVSGGGAFMLSMDDPIGPTPGIVEIRLLTSSSPSCHLRAPLDQCRDVLPAGGADNAKLSCIAPESIGERDFTLTRRSRTVINIQAACRSFDFTGTNRMLGRVTASLWRTDNRRHVSSLQRPGA
jgi:hypothetical protein